MAREFKKQLLYVHVDQVIYFTNLMKTSLKNLTFFIDSVQRVLKLQLTDENKIQLKDYGSEFIEEALRKLFPYSSASRSINLELLGMAEIESLIKFYSEHSDSWQGFEFELTADGFKEPKNYVKAITETYSVYTDSEAQNELIEISKKIISLHKQIDEMRIPQLKGSGVEAPGATKIITYDVIKECIVTNVGFIETIGSNYKTFWKIAEEKKAKREEQRRERAKIDS